MRLLRSILLILIAASLLATHAAGGDFFPDGLNGYRDYLQAMEEPSIYGLHLDKTTEKYRFLWARTFHKPIAIRIWKDRAGITLRIVRLSGKGGYQIGKIERDATIAITSQQWDHFLEILNGTGFWDLPTTNRDVIGTDGSQWVLEGRVQGKYHVVDRWCPLVDTSDRLLEDFVASCRYLLKLSGEEIPKKEDY